MAFFAHSHFLSKSPIWFSILKILFLNLKLTPFNIIDLILICNDNVQQFILKFLLTEEKMLTVIIFFLIKKACLLGCIALFKIWLREQFVWSSDNSLREELCLQILSFCLKNFLEGFIIWTFVSMPRLNFSNFPKAQFQI